MKNEFRIRLREILSQKFNLVELQALCFDLNIDYEDLQGSSKQAKVIELVRYCERSERIEELIAGITRFRPNLTLPFENHSENTPKSSSELTADSIPSVVVARPVNLSFDAYTIGDWPSGWFNSKGFVPNVSTNYSARVVARPDDGAGACVVFWNNNAKEGGFGSLMQRCPAHSMAGRVIRLTAEIKTENVKQWAGMWLRVDGEVIPDLVFDNMSNRPIKGSTPWGKYSIKAQLPKETAWLNYGIILVGNGTMWADNFELSVWTDNGRWETI
jgi:hypothetical protein